MTKQATDPLKDKLITPQQYTQIFGTPPPAGSVPSDSKGDAVVYFRLKNPELSVSGNPSGFGVQTYQTVQLNSGKTVLGVPTEGTSFAAPTETGRQSQGVTR